MEWIERHGIWTCGAFTVRLDFNPRTEIALFELYDSTRYVDVFSSAQAAQDHARSMCVANDNYAKQRRRTA